MTDQRVTQVAVEQWVKGSLPSKRVTQVSVEHWARPSTATLRGQVTQVSVEHWSTVAFMRPGAAQMDGQAQASFAGNIIVTGAAEMDGHAQAQFTSVAVSKGAAEMDGSANAAFVGSANQAATSAARMDGQAAVGFAGSIIRVPKPPQSITITGDRHVRRGGGDYALQFLNLLPFGPAWSRDPSSTLVATVRGLADYWGFVDGRAADLLETESDPRATVELLTDWERNWGLPDSCISNPPTSLFERRADLVAKMTLLGAQSRAFFIQTAAKLGYTITITEYAPYMCGVSQVGDTRGLDPAVNPVDYRWRLGPPSMRYYWTIHVSAKYIRYFHCNSSQCGIDRLLAFGEPADLECLFGRWKPAHTQIVYDFSPVGEGLDFTTAFDSQYLALGIM